MSCVKEIPLSQGKIALVDAEDFEHLMQWKWNCDPRGYVRRFHYFRNEENKLKRVIVRMHRLIMSAPVGMEVDHINGLTHDNRKSNLRLCTRAENNRNQRLRKNKVTSRYKGVCWNKRLNKWVAQIQADNQMMHLGVFEHEVDAAQVYNFAALKHFGEYARFNLAGGG